MMSSAINQGYTLKDEKWRLICEGLGLDFEQIIAPPEPEQVSNAAPAQERELPSYPAPESVQQTAPAEPAPSAPVQLDPNVVPPGMTIVCAERESLFLLAMYTEGRLAVDIEQGMKVDPMKLWAILDALKAIKDASM